MELGSGTELKLALIPSVWPSPAVLKTRVLAPATVLIVKVRAEGCMNSPGGGASGLIVVVTPLTVKLWKKLSVHTVTCTGPADVAVKSCVQV